MTEIILSLFGLLFIYVGIKVIRKSLHLKKNGIRTLGTVISTSSEMTRSRIDNNMADGSGRIYRSTVEYTTEDGRTLEAEIGEGRGVEDAIGSDRKIIYDPELPQEVQADNVLSMSIAPYLFLACGLVSFLWGILEMFGVINVMQ